MSSRLRVGILGSGFGGKVHAPAFAAHERFELVAIASPNSAARVAAERNIPASFDTLEAMLDASKLDVLAIAAPPFAHHAAILTGLAHGLHIVCEKPFTLNVAQAEEMVARANTVGTACIIAHEFRFLPTRVAIDELVANNHLGVLRQIEVVQNGGFLRQDSRRPRGWWFSEEQGGGIAGAWLSHAIDTANRIAGRPPQRVSGFVRTANTQREDAQGAFSSDAADGAFALLDYGDGLVARLCADGTLRVDASTLAVHGELRTAIASGMSIHEQRLFTVDEDETSELEVKAQSRSSLAAVNENVPAFAAMLDAFANAIDGKPHQAATFADGLATQRVLGEIGYEAGS